MYSHNKYAYIHIYMFMQDTYWRNKLIRRSNKFRRKTSLTKFVPLTLLQGFERVVQALRVRGSWRSNINFNILTSTLMAVNVVSFSFCRCSTGGLGVHSAGCWLSLLHLISIFSGPQLIRAQIAPSAWCGFPYHISSLSVRSPWNSNSTGSSNSTELYNRSTPTQSLKSNV